MPITNCQKASQTILKTAKAINSYKVTSPDPSNIPSLSQLADIQSPIPSG